MTGIQLKAIRERLGLSAAVFDDHSAIKAVDRRKYEAACARRTYSDTHRATCSQWRMVHREKRKGHSCKQ
jgi:hypothetical protein